jgi:quercetin dioxygenase-like cupin family protein
MSDNHIDKLRELTKELPVLSNIVAERYKDSVAYAMLAGICTGEELFYNQSIAVQRSFMNKGAKFPIHLHNQIEWIIVSRGHLINDTEGVITELKDGDGVKIERGHSHCIEAITDTWLIGITIPASEGYPHG